MSNNKKIDYSNFLNSNVSLDKIDKLIGSKDYFEEIFENNFNKLISSIGKVK